MGELVAFAPELALELVNDVEPQSLVAAEEPQSPLSPPVVGPQASAAAVAAGGPAYMGPFARERDSGLPSSTSVFWPQPGAGAGSAAADYLESHLLLLSACNTYQQSNTALQTFHGTALYCAALFTIRYELHRVLDTVGAVHMAHLSIRIPS